MAANSPQWLYTGSPGSGLLIEQPGSPHLVNGEKKQLERTFRGTYAAALAAQPYKGQTTMFAGILFRVESSTMVYDAGGQGVLTITYSGRDPLAPLPLTEVDIDFVLKPRPIEQVEKYATELDKLTPAEKIEALRYISGIVKNPYPDAFTDNASLNTNTQGYQIVFGNVVLAELLGKQLAGILHWLARMATLTITQYSFDEPPLDAGGYIDDPTPYLPGPGLPGHYTLPPDTDLKWIRQGDRSKFNGSHYSLIQTWEGDPSPDPEIYAA